MKFTNQQKKIITATEPRILCVAAAGSGKSIPNSTIIPTSEGWKKVEEIRIGDYLINELGKKTKVLGVFPQGKKEIYEITFGDGRIARCCKDHIWSVNKMTWGNKNEYREYTVTQLLKEELIYSDRRAKFSIPCSKAIEWTEKEYDIDPYVMGAFLGDGCCKGHSQLVLSSENDVIPCLCAEKMGERVKVELWYNNKYQWRFYTEEHGEKHYFNTLNFFKNYKKEVLQYSYNKSIPKRYKEGSITQRLSLIQGLMDTDGSIERSNGQLKFTSTSLILIKDVQEVLNSLGYVSRLYQEKRKELYTNECYYILINIPNKEKEKLFRLKRKKDIAFLYKDIPQKHDYTRTTIRSIKCLKEEEEMTCFYVDNPKHLFLMNDCIVTHNTSILTERVRHLIVNCHVDPKDICVISFTNLAAEEMRKRLGDTAYGVFIGTIHSFAAQICIENSVNVMESIEKMDFNTILKKVLTIPDDRYPHIKYLFMDECQDTSPEDLELLDKLTIDNFFLVGDYRQLIYSFRGSSPDIFYRFYNDPTFKIYYLTKNFRCPPNVITFANRFVDKMKECGPNCEAYKTKAGFIDEDCTLNDVIEEITWTDNYGKWAILCRTNAEIEEAQRRLDAENIPNLTFKKGDLELDEMEQLITENKVKVLTIHASKGLSFPNVAVVGARVYNADERRISYVAATRAENNLYWCPTVVKKGTKAKCIDTTRAAMNRIQDIKNKVIQF